jgi:hypothetical protein
MSLFKNVITKEVQGKQLQFRLLPATEGLGMAMKLLRIVAPVLEDVEDEEADVAIVSNIIANIGDADVLQMVKRLLQDISIDGEEVKFDEYFVANYGEMIEILSVIFKENFSTFFTVNLSNLL